MLVASAIRHRLRGKQVAPYPCPAASPPIHFSDIARSVQSGAAQAIEAENCAADGLLVLPWDARRRHIHWTHCRTHNPQDVQPHQLSREEFWNHLAQCYKEIYPKAESDTGSPLEFGVVCKERHKDAPRMEDQSEHNHAATFSSVQLYWRRISKLSS